MIMILDTIRSLNDLTPQERYLADYVLSHPQKVMRLTINELAAESFTSTSTVSRLCKKACPGGFGEFKLLLASDMPYILELGGDLGARPLDAGESLTGILEKIEQVRRRSVDYTRSHLDPMVLERVAGFIRDAERVEIFGEGINFALAQTFCLNFEEVGLTAGAYSALNPMHAKIMGRDHPGRTLAFVLTHTGVNPRMVDIACRLSHEDYRLIVICDSTERDICRYADESMAIMCTKDTMELSNIVYQSALHYLFDVFVSVRMVSDHARLSRVNEDVDREK
ncbi:regulator of phosphosugar metobolism [Bifidobacterium callitrichos]|nr:regulator of phosphosugar metobolism [Bifidobacterium callitrichos]